MRIAFATDAAHPDLTADDRLVVPHLREAGVEVVPARWGAPLPDVAAVVIRSPWDYFHALPDFLGWIDALPVPVHNAAHVLRWNADKRYLRILEAKGVTTIPTLRVPAESDLAAVTRARGWRDEVVVKPEVSGGGHATFRVRLDAPGSVRAAEAGMRAAGGTFLVQPFLGGVVEGGELSLVYLGGRYSHAVRKRPARGGFLVQAEHGGASEPAEAPPAALAAAERVFAFLDEPLLYARVDLIEDRGAWFLVELELIEPELFLRHDPEAPGRFAEAIVARL